MKRILFILSIMFAVVSCQNDGHIGRLFGTWQLAQMTENGETPEAFTPGETTWSFQNNIVYITKELPHMERILRVGTWAESNADGHKYLELDYTQSTDEYAPGTGPYRAPEWLGFPENKVIRLEYVKDSSREMVLTWTSDEGLVYIYTLKKTW